MSSIEFEGRAYTYREGETVLEALLRGGATVDYSCRRGTCQACVLQLDGEHSSIPLLQNRLPRARLNAGTFLACQTLAAPLAVKRVGRASLFVPARLVEKRRLSPDHLLIRLEPPGSFMWNPGQYINIRHPSGALRSYAVTSLLFVDYWLELHVHCWPDGIVCNWLRDELQVGEFLELQGPFGECHYHFGLASHRLLLVTNGLGAYPLLGVARDALFRRHAHPITLHCDEAVANEPHFQALAAALQAQHNNLTVTGSSATLGTLANTSIFLCGLPDLVNREFARACAFGLPPDSIYRVSYDPSDGQLPAGATAPARQSPKQG